ncbi:MAG TPA: cell division protein SepF [Eubacteriales bacterium]|nr:cell division protein SepF [Clostridia bacterium]HRR90036.1 cell division protein SepF [Eubacteriales bacterium]HRU83988.1 cell division protein SepF [Eubacteriales bacterium]
MNTNKIFGGKKSPGAATDERDIVSVFSIKSLDEAEQIINSLKRGEQAIVDFSELSLDSAEKAMNILSGAVYALSGGIKRLKGRMFLLTARCGRDTGD